MGCCWQSDGNGYLISWSAVLVSLLLGLLVVYYLLLYAR
jgi:hypothetical protein